MNDVIEELVDLFQEAGEAHHQAFIETDGVDPDWPLWYADYLHEKLNEKLEASMTKSELVYLLVLMDKEQRMDAPGANWRRYYASYLTEQYL